MWSGIAPEEPSRAPGSGELSSAGPTSGPAARDSGVARGGRAPVYRGAPTTASAAAGGPGVGRGPSVGPGSAGAGDAVGGGTPDGAGEPAALPGGVIGAVAVVSDSTFDRRQVVMKSAIATIT